MKKAYVKPQIMIDSFAVSTNIASGCEKITNLQGEGACGWIPDDRWTGGVIFTDATTGCQTTPTESRYDTLCYHVPSESYNLFSS